jgi:hypothetical protein
MKDLAEVYISIRAGSRQKGIPKLDVNLGNPLNGISSAIQ